MRGLRPVAVGQPDKAAETGRRVRQRVRAAVVARTKVRRIGAEHQHGDEGERADSSDEQHRRAALKAPLAGSLAARSPTSLMLATPAEARSRNRRRARDHIARRPGGRRTGCARPGALSPANRFRARSGIPLEAAISRLVSAGRTSRRPALAMSSIERNSKWWMASAKRPVGGQRVGLLQPGTRVGFIRSPFLVPPPVLRPVRGAAADPPFAVAQAVVQRPEQRRGAEAITVHSRMRA